MVDLTARKGMTGTQDTAEHHAIVITGVQPGELDREERLVYTLIVGRMLETFMPPCKVEYTTVETVCAARKFRIRTYRILETGWLGVFQREHLVSENCVLCPVPPELLREETLPVAAAAIFSSLMGCCRENKVNPKLWMHADGDRWQHCCEESRIVLQMASNVWFRENYSWR